MTEEEAKTKWCWKLRNWETVGDVNDPGEARCIGSACMAWRDRYITPSPSQPNPFSHQPYVPSIVTGVVFDGHCGLAGKPE
jgi:hypothetical protein